MKRSAPASKVAHVAVVVLTPPLTLFQDCSFRGCSQIAADYPPHLRHLDLDLNLDLVLVLDLVGPTPGA